MDDCLQFFEDKDSVLYALVMGFRDQVYEWVEQFGSEKKHLLTCLLHRGSCFGMSSLVIRTLRDLTVSVPKREEKPGKSA